MIVMLRQKRFICGSTSQRSSLDRCSVACQAVRGPGGLRERSERRERGAAMHAVRAPCEA